MASILSKIGSLLWRAIKLAGPKLVQAAKGAAKTASKAKVKYVDVASKYASKAISKAGSFVTSKMKPGTGKRILQGTVRLAASEKLLKPLITDLTYKGAKQIAKRVPVVGKTAEEVMDTLDVVIGIPFI